MIFTILYLVFFIYLNFSIYRSLKIGFKENKKQSLISAISIVILLLFHKFLHFEGMMKGGILFLLIFFSLGLMIMHYIHKIIRYGMDNALAEKNPNLYNSDFYDTYSDVTSFITQVIFPIGITFFQIMVILNPGIQKAMNP